MVSTAFLFKSIKNEEIERGILLLEEESSNPTVILSDLNKLLKNG